MTIDRAASAHDWAGRFRSYVLAWGLPHIALFIGLLVTVPLRAAIWSVALTWMGTACIVNAQRCGRTHCRYTGPFYLIMLIPVFGAGWWSDVISIYGWIALGAMIVVGGKIIWWSTERAWGKFS